MALWTGHRTAVRLLLQYAIERMGTIIEANIANGLKAMGWNEASELDEEAMEKIQRIANG